MAELVDALDSGSSGQCACGGSSPPFRTMSIFVCLLAVGCLIIGGTGCKSEAQTNAEEAFEETLTLHDQVYRILETNVDKPKVALDELRKLEESTRTTRTERRQQGKVALEALNEKEKTAFDERATQQYNDYAAKLGTILKRFEAIHRPSLQRLTSSICQ